MQLLHFGAANGVTGSCHMLKINDETDYLIDCGMFQGDDARRENLRDIKNNPEQYFAQINFPLDNLQAVLITHCHVDHVGRIPALLAAGYTGPIYASRATCAVLDIVLADCIKVGLNIDPYFEKIIIKKLLNQLDNQLIAVDYNQWVSLPTKKTRNGWRYSFARFTQAGHILGSSIVEIKNNKWIGESNSFKNVLSGTKKDDERDEQRIVFSGDLGSSQSVLLPHAISPKQADLLVLESTYGDRNHPEKENRILLLQKVIEKAVADNGVVLIPAFSIGRTQEILYELEQIIYQTSGQSLWQQMDVILDSPMAQAFTKKYQNFSHLWDQEALCKLKEHRHPLDFSQLVVIDSHKEHLKVVNYLATRKKPAIVIAASGMCSGGRIVHYLQKFLPDITADVIFVGYQAKGSKGRELLELEDNYIFLEGKKVEVQAKLHVIDSYSAHADQHGLLSFIENIKSKPSQIRLVHGEQEAKEELIRKIKALYPQIDVLMGSRAD